MSTLESRLSKLEAAAGVGLDPVDRFERECNSKSSEWLLQALYWLRARISNTEPPETPVEVVKWLERVMGNHRFRHTEMPKAAR